MLFYLGSGAQSRPYMKRCEGIASHKGRNGSLQVTVVFTSQFINYALQVKTFNS